MAGILVPITMFICGALMIIVTTYINRTAKHKERMALIENGLDASIFDKPKKEKKRKADRPHNKYKALKYGMMAVGLGLGLILGTFLNVFLRIEPLPQFAMMLICGGGALIQYYNIVAKKEREEKDRQMYQNDDLV